MKNTKKKGFTLTELTVVLVIIAIIAAIAVPSFIKYWRIAEFQKNESNAKTIYLAAESKLTYYRSSGQWEKFQERLKREGTQAVFADSTSELNGRIYTVTLDANTYQEKAGRDDLLLQLIDDYSYDKQVMNGAIAIEIDSETGEVYSAFFATKCKGLSYAERDADDYLTMRDRDYESRKKRLLGYYSTEDTANVVHLKPIRLRITTISLQNSEKLSLNWSSNVGNSLDVSYELTFYKNSDKSKQFTMTVSPYEMRKNGWTATSGTTEGLVSFEIQDKKGNSKGQWTFPITYSDNRYSLILDAMMSAKVQAVLASGSGTTAEALARTSSTSICRLGKVASDLKNPQDIYATVKAVSYAGKKDEPSTQEYRNSEAVSSNVANSMYADGTKDGNVKIAAFRHLSNIRYYDESNTAEFALTSRNLDWSSVGTGLYDFELETKAGGSQRQKLSWKENSKEKTVDFPAIAKLSSGHTFSGKRTQTLISNLSFGEESVNDDSVASAAGQEKSKYLGLFEEVYGTIEDVTLQNVTLTLGQNEESKTFNSLQGIGIFAGRSEGTMNHVAVTSAEDKGQTQVLVDFEKIRTNISVGSDTAAVGGISGIFADQDQSGNTLEALASGRMSDITMEGNVEVSLPKTLTDRVEDYAYGVGGIVGYAKMQTSENAAKLLNCTNHADVSGNLMVGGIVGTIDSQLIYQGSYTDDDLAKIANIKEADNDGLILCTAEVNDTTLQGKYFGGIAGYAEQSLIYDAASASGRAAQFSFDESKKTEYLKGKYVGGIVGYGNSTLVNNCSTEKDGYVLGSDYVGGIAGALGGNISEAIRADSVVAVTTNSSYVIGQTYVGGIVGQNEQNVTLKNCVNNGVAACYDRYVGGIVGYNEKDGMIYDCASYLSDYDSSIFNMIVDTWNARGDYAGGIAGYNDGQITFTAESQAITVKSVSSIVVGGSYVGGVAGFNDVNGSLDVHYTLIGGRIYAYGDCAGGGFGLNASTELLQQELTIKPGSVQGHYYVGGCIGANIVNLTADTSMDRFRADNVLGTITGDAFCGGLMGYQRTYGTGQIQTAENGSIREAVESSMQAAGNTQERLFPGLQGDGDVPTVQGRNVPGIVKKSENSHVLTISTNTNTGTMLNTETNNIPLKAGMYAGGIVGYCEKNSNLIIKNCKNAGNISYADSGSDRSVLLEVYAKSDEIGKKSIPDEGKSIEMHLVGGIISVNLENQVIDHCTNTGSMSGYSGIGGVVGLNAGLIYKCTLSEHFGNAALNYLGGIAGINIGPDGSGASAAKTYAAGTETGTTNVRYSAGTIESCSTQPSKTVSGNSSLGGIVGWNLTDGVVKQNTSYANITASGNYAGGIAGRNSGMIQIPDDKDDTTDRTIEAADGKAIGGIVGINETQGKIEVTAKGSATEVVAVGSGLTVTGETKVGGIAGINEGQIGKESQTADLTCKAKLVRASHGIVGGIVGETKKDILHAVNRCTNVTADAGTAGGITAENHSGQTIGNCKNYGNVSSSDGYAAGIAATNEGTIRDCVVSGGSGTGGIKIHSLGEKEIGAVCAINSGTVSGSYPEGNVTLQGDASIFGGVTGRNTGTVAVITLTSMPVIDATKSKLTVGGAVGANEAIITQIVAKDLKFAKFSGYRYLGGITGTNGGSGKTTAGVSDCVYSGTMTEKTGAAGNCYGGIAGINYATLSGCKITKITMEIKGVYTATSTSTAAQKESLASHAGGITGKNETSATITSCVIDNNPDSRIRADYGMLGGVTGFNKGTITMSGSSITAAVMNLTEEQKQGRKAVEALNTNAVNVSNTSGKDVLKADTDYVNWPGDRTIANIESLSYNGGSKVISGRMQMYMTSNGNLGGIAAYNGTTGTIDQCVSGNWFLNNKSSAISVGTGGIIGMNESEKDLSYLVNAAFVGRQLSSNDTNRFAGGIIGNQNNTTSNEWHIENCINYGTIYCYRTHYSGGIMGQWTGTGGTIENCRNYGMLQTSYGTAWIGASAGIVAQLYHAQEGQEYNVIGCGNYGSVFTKNGRNQADGQGANDSAGILGNITTYKVQNAQDASNFKVQILDCFNAPGVEIYSSSMASGIFGFLSCDNPVSDFQQAKKDLKASTGNVVIRIERCRNFSYKLLGSQYATGIFGDRLQGWKNTTIVKDNYSIKSQPSYMHGSHDGSGAEDVYAVYASGIGEGNSSNMNAEDRINNYYIEGIQSWGYSNLKLGEGKGTLGKGSGSAGNGYYESGTGRYCVNMFFVYDMTEQKYFLASINNRTNSGMTNINGKDSYINENGYIVNRNGSKQVQVLYYIDNSSYDNSRLYDYIMKDSTNPVFVNARNSYKRLEGVIDNKILKPYSAEAQVSNGKVTLHITPQSLPGSYDNERSAPFAYEVEVTDLAANRKVVRTVYTEEGSFNIPSGMSNNLQIRVRSVSMYDEVEPSDWYKIGENNINKVLPDPDIVIELVEKSDVTNGCSYRYRLKNLDEYNKTDKKGDAAYPNWQVTVNVQSVGTVTLDADNPTRTMEVSNLDKYIYQMVAQASSKPGNTTLMQSSKQISTAVSLPYYRPPITLKTWTPQLSKNITITGNTLDDLTVNVELNAGSNAMDTPPIYRVELVGTWNGQVDTVLAKEDTLIVSKGSANATFSDLPEYISEAKDIKIRIWYAASGLGPVYTYWDEDVTEANANIKELTGVDENGSETWDYSYSSVLAQSGSKQYFENYTYWSGVLWQFLPTPKLDNVGSTLIPEIDENNDIYYTFTWDTGVSGTNNANYQTALTGIDDSDREVVISTDGAYTGGKSLRINGSDWNYKEVRLKVTRIGDASQKQIGLSSEGTYSVKQRLARPGQPMVENLDNNELDYQIRWSPLTSETGCAGYQVCIRKYNSTTPGAEEVLENLVTTDQKKNGVYTINTDLEEYAGQRVVVYVIAKADSNGSYIDSVSGVTCELPIPKRLAKPNVTWKVGWKYDKTSPVEVSSFRSGGLRVSLTADAASIPSGGSAYLLKAYIYDSEQAAAAATDSDPGEQFLASYPADGSLVQMSVTDSRNYYQNLTNLSIQHAGKWIVFYARISSGGGNISSLWTKSAAFRLPYVKLEAPTVSSDTKTYKVKAKVTENPDIPGQEKTWNVQHTVLMWDSVECANLYSIDLAGNMTDPNSQTGKTLISAKVRVQEMSDGTVEVQQYVSQKNKDTGANEWVWKSVAKSTDSSQPAGTSVYKLSSYSVAISSNYKALNQAEVYYELTLTAELEATKNADGGFSYTLKLPDAAKVTADDGTVITHSDLAVTESAAFKANVTDNLSEQGSAAYAESAANEIKWTN